MKGFELDNLEGREFGPYYGPAVIGEAYESGEWTSIQIEKRQEEEEMITVCREENLDPDDVCEQLPQNSQLKAFADWDMKHIKSLYIPKGQYRKRFLFRMLKKFSLIHIFSVGD